MFYVAYFLVALLPESDFNAEVEDEPYLSIVLTNIVLPRRMSEYTYAYIFSSALEYGSYFCM